MCDEVETFPQRKRRCQGARGDHQRKESSEPKNLPISLSEDCYRTLGKIFQRNLKNPLTTDAEHDIISTEIRERKPLKTRKETKL